MILNTVVTLVNQQTEVTYVSGDSWSWPGLMLPAFLQLAGSNVDQTVFWIAEWDSVEGQWLNLAQPWPGPTSQNQAVTIMTDFTKNLNLPLANPGDVNIADLWNRAMLALDARPAAAVPLHGPTHVGTGIDPVPLASTSDSGMLNKLSGNPGDYVGGDNSCHPVSGVPTAVCLPFAGAILPANFLWCDGAAHLRATYTNLYTALGGAQSPWGQGDGSTTFNTPDFRGRGLIGAGTGLNLSARVLGQMLGEEAHTLVIGELPPISLPYTFDNWLATGGTIEIVTTGGTYQLTLAKSGTTGSLGGNRSHNNMQPSAVTNWIIRV